MGIAHKGRRRSDIEEYLPLVRAIAGRIRRRLPTNVELDDLVQEGLIGLNEALERFEQGQHPNFEAYACRRIEGAMLDALRKDDPLTRDERIRVRKIRAAVQRLEHELGRAPRAKEVANELRWPLDKLHRSLADVGAHGPRVDDTQDKPSEDGTHDLDPMVELSERQRNAALNAAFDALEEADRYVMECIYDRNMTLKEIGATLGVTESRISQIASAVVAKLKRRLRGV